MEGRLWGHSPLSPVLPASQIPLPGHPTPQEALGTLEQPWTWGEESKASEKGLGPLVREPRQEGAVKEPTPSPSEAWNAGFPQGGGHGWWKSTPGGRHFWLLI